MLDQQLTDEQRHWKDVARAFSNEVIRPIAESLDRSDDLRRDFPWEMLDEGHRRGLKTLAGVPKEFGGAELDFVAQLAVVEELAAVDTSCAKIFSQCWKMARVLSLGGNAQQREQYLPHFCNEARYLIATGLTEPGAGTDSQFPFDDPKAGVSLSAVRDGDDYVLNGRKHFISFGSIAQLYIIIARTDRTVGVSQGCSAFIVPRETPGFSVGSTHDKVGFRMYLQGEFDCDDVRIPVSNMLGGRQGINLQIGAASNIELCTTALATAQRALDAAVRFATEETRGGRKLAADPAVQSLLGRMYGDVEAARSTLWRSTALVAGGVDDHAMTMAAKVFCTDAVVRVCNSAVELAGMSGVLRDLPFERYARDAICMPHMDMTNPMNKLKIVQHLEDWISSDRLPEWGRATAHRHV